MTKRELSTHTTFVVFTENDKQGTLYPDVFGPFANEAEAIAFIRLHPHANVLPDDSIWPGAIVMSPVDGGYAGATIVNADTAADPEEVPKWWEESACWDDESTQEWVELQKEWLATRSGNRA